MDIVKDRDSVRSLTGPLGEVQAHVRSPFLDFRNYILDLLVISVDGEERIRRVREFVLEKWRLCEREMTNAVAEEMGRLVDECLSLRKKE